MVPAVDGGWSRLGCLLVGTLTGRSILGLSDVESPGKANVLISSLTHVNFYLFNNSTSPSSAGIKSSR